MDRTGHTRTRTQQRPLGRESAAMGSVALPGGFPAGHPCLGKQSSLPATGGARVLNPRLHLGQKARGRWPAEETFS